MPEYIIKTNNDRNLVIEADRYNYNATEEAYEFFKRDDKADTQKVATVPSRTFLAIVEKNTEQADFYDHYDLNEDETDDVCLGCRFSELLESEEFEGAVMYLIDAFIRANFHDGKFISEESDAGAQL